MNKNVSKALCACVLALATHTMSLTAEGAGGFTIITADTAASSSAVSAEWKATLAQWEASMVSWGRIHCKTISTKLDVNGSDQSPDQLLAATFYDAMQVYLQIWQYTKDTSWKDCAKAASDIYRDAYVLRADLMGQVPGHWNFTTGLTMDYQLNGDETSKKAVILLSQRANAARDNTVLEQTVGAEVSREVAYAIRSHLNAETLGQPRRIRTTELVTVALGHIDQWFISKSFRSPPSYANFGIPVGVCYIQPFMAGLTMEALIMWYEATHDPRVPPAIKAALDWLWANAWVVPDQAFWYDNYVTDPKLPFPAKSGVSDLNMLIAPAYAWYYMITGDVTYRDRADKAFAGSIGSYLADGKHFNENYSYGFQYVSRRLLADGASSSVTSFSLSTSSTDPLAPASTPAIGPQTPASAPPSVAPPTSNSPPAAGAPPKQTYWKFFFGK